MDFQSRNLTIPRGKVFFAAYATGTQNPGPMRELGNCPEFTLTRDSEKLTHYSSQSGLRVKDDEITIESSLSGSVTTDDIKTENVAYWFMSTTSTVTATSATGTVETFGAAKIGDHFQLGRTNAAPSGARKVANVVVKDAAATKVLNTDYELDTATGIVNMLVAAASLNVTYDITASTREQVALAESKIEGELKFVSFNPAGAQSDITIPRAVISPNGDMSLINDPESTAYQTLGLSITVLRKGSLSLAYRDGRPA